MKHVTVAGALAGIGLCIWLLYAKADGEKKDQPPKNDAKHKTHQRKPLPPAAEIAKLPEDGGKQFNRLVFESSPYLRQHARNPVNWYPWGKAAFARAKKEDKPIFLSVGYATCHWCHVMERESFENQEIADIINKHFIAIKVDREERPDVDNIYMAALQAMRNGGGWPMNMFLFPDRRPFFGGTYWPPNSRGGRPGFKFVLNQIAKIWSTDRQRVKKSAEQLTRMIQEKQARGVAEIGAKTLQDGQKMFAEQYDARHGGFGNRPKFPRSHSLSFLLRHWKRTGQAPALRMVETTLKKMAQGGMYDHLGGGFHRYSTTADWLVPHFEKMLYDQALLARTYIEAYQATENPYYAGVAHDIFRYVLRDMRDPKGGFYSAEDADSEGVEGKFYVWSRAEIIQLLGADDGALFCRVYDIQEAGNFKEEATQKLTGENIPHLAKQLTGPEEKKLAPLRKRLFDLREKRIHPYKDDKVLTDWNGLMIAALAQGGRVFNEPRYLDAARKAADFVLQTMRTKQGRLLHRYREGKVGILAYLDDHAYLLLGLLELYEATFEARWLAAAKQLAAQTIKLFWDTKGKGFHFAGADNEKLIARTKQLYDGARPSGNSVAVLALLRLGKLTQDQPMVDLGQAALKRFSVELSKYPMGYPFMLQALSFSVGPTREVVLAGDPTDKRLQAMQQAIARRFLPNLVVALHPSGKGGAAIQKLIPFLKNQRPINGKGTAYVCQNYQCKLPTNDVAKMIKQIEGKD